MRLFPDSLAGRTVLLLAAVIAVVEVATFSLIGNFRRNAHVNQTVQLIASQVRLLQTVLPGLDANGRRLLSMVDTDEQGLQLRADDAAVPGHQPRFHLARQLAVELAERLNSPVLLRHGGPGMRSGLWIGFMAGGERWWLVLPPPRFEPQALPPELWIGLAATLAAVLAIAGLFVRGIVGPLARLGEAVAATGDDAAGAAGGYGLAAADLLIPAGPRELRRLAERHNTMRRQLAAAAAERREMLAGLTHDLRAPLARLRLRLALLESDGSDPLGQGPPELDGLTRDVNDMERIVGQCLAFLRSEEMDREGEALVIAEQVRDEVARHCELGRPVQLAIADGAAACRVMIGAGMLQRLLDNLIANALQHGAPPVEIRLATRGDKAVALSVGDHGPGIGVADRQRALEAFTQLEPARATQGSCGLGLAIVRRIAAGCGGELILEDAAGGGLAAVVCLPVVGAGAAPPSAR